MKTRKSILSASLVALSIVSGGVSAHGGAGMGMMNQGPGMGMHGMGMGMMNQGQGMGMMDHGMMQGMMSMSPDQLDEAQLDKIAEHMTTMHRQMEKIAETTDPEARRELVREHLKSKQEFMHERRKMMMERRANQQKEGSWQQHMEQRMQHMEQMMKQQQQ